MFPNWRPIKSKEIVTNQLIQRSISTTRYQEQRMRSFSVDLQPPWALASDFQFHDHFTDGRTSWTSDQLVARPLPKRRTTQTRNKHIHIPNIHALSGIRTHDPGFRASEDSTCLRPLGYCDRRRTLYKVIFKLNRCTYSIAFYLNLNYRYICSCLATRMQTTSMILWHDRTA
jgi:hypothetical protein